LPSFAGQIIENSGQFPGLLVDCVRRSPRDEQLRRTLPAKNINMTPIESLFENALRDPDFKYFCYLLLVQVLMLMKIIFLPDLLHGYLKQQ